MRLAHRIQRAVEVERSQLRRAPVAEEPVDGYADHSEEPPQSEPASPADQIPLEGIEQIT